MSLKKELFRNFSHIYVEKEAFNYTLTQEILSKFNSKIIEIGNYKEFFSKNNQNFSLQKLSQKIILAVKKEKFLYKGAKVCESFGNENFYYISNVLNCIYDCEYCYLQGVYSSGNIVIFVNIEDMFKEVEEVLRFQSMYICISYDTDLMALDGITGMVEKWYDFLKNHSNLKIELRTKSNNISMLKELKVNKNLIVAWTLSPENFIKKSEKGTVSLVGRIRSAKLLMEKGWNVRICFDPVIKIENFEDEYGKLVDLSLTEINPEKILDVSIGTFRISKEYLKRMRKNRDGSALLSYPFSCEDGVYSYEKEEIKKMLEFMEKKVLQYVEKEKVFI